ncbi:hypothetical protein AMTRI_Chr06g170490 [Amborella trichopoda]
MGCTNSISRHINGKKKQLHVPEVAIFVPTLRIPKEIDFQRALQGTVTPKLVEKLSSLRSQIVLIAEGGCLKFSRPTNNIPVLEGGSSLSDLQRALEEYLPVVLGLTRKDYNLVGMVNFKWIRQDNQQETSIESTWYELLSVLHLMAMVSLSQANQILIPEDPIDASERKVSEGCKTRGIDLLLLAAGYLEFCVRCIYIHMPLEVKKRLPRDLHEDALEATSLQALAQGIEMQLGFALESEKATLSVKRRLACEQVEYLAKAYCCLPSCNFVERYERKHLLFIKWKYLEAKAAAYFYHGLILGKGGEAVDHMNAVKCLLAADELLVDSKKACLSFCVTAPVTRASPLWGAMKHLHHKIPEVALKKSQMYDHLFNSNKFFPQALPELPEFPLSLKPDSYEFPSTDSSWENGLCDLKVQTLKEHLKDCEDSDLE